jgi:four helix bundle protein
MRRASSSISSNISEGSGRTSPKDQAHFYQMAYSSNLELLNHFYTAMDLEYIEKDTFMNIRTIISSLSAQIGALRKSCFKSKIKP